MTAPKRSFAGSVAWLLVGCLACGLVLLQTLGSMHGVVHGAPHSAVHERSVPLHDHADHASHTEFVTSAFESLFSSHDGGADCRLFDQASLGDAVSGLAQSNLPLLPPSVAVAAFQGSALARWAALFDARGPP